MVIPFYLLYIFFAVAPSTIWMFFYLGKDVHPEPKKKILKVFCFGMVVAVIAVILEMGILKIIDVYFPGTPFKDDIWFIALKYFILVALIEEVLKFLIVRKFILQDWAIDEPLDIMLYLTVSALGFAAVENLLLIFFTITPSGTIEILRFSIERLIGATFLHTLASATLGFFWAISFCYEKKGKIILFLGFVIAIVLHGLYNFCIVELSGIWQIVIPVFVIIGLSIFTTFGFITLRKLKSVCKISI